MTKINSSTIILVHGLWMTKTALMWHVGYLRRRGFSVERYSYRSRTATLSDAAQGLAQMISMQKTDCVHLVGHSMGGLVILQMLEEFPSPRIGRVVLMGTPYRDSLPARVLDKFPAGRWYLGKVLPQWLQKDKSKLVSKYEIGVIAGSRNVGLGRIIARLPLPNDGTVAVRETQIPGMRDSILLPVSHTGMLMSAKVAKQVCAFLERGRFDQALTTK